VSGEHLLVVDDSHEMREFLANVMLRPEGYRVDTARNGVEGLAFATAHTPDLIITDMAMPEMDGLTMIEEMRLAGLTIPVILMTAEGSESTAVRAMRAGVMDYFVKPFDPDDMHQAIRRILSSVRIGSVPVGIPDQRRVEALNLLMQIGKSMTTITDLETVLGRVVESAVYLTGAEEGTLMLVDKPTGELYIRAAKNMREGVRSLRLPIRDSLAGRVVRAGQPLVISGQGAQKFKTQYLVQSLLYVPLIIHQEVIGVLGVHNRQNTAPISQEHVGLMSGLADYAAIAIHNAQTLKRSMLARDKLFQIFNQMRDPVLVLDPEGLLLMSNAAAREFLDLAQASVPMGMALSELTSNRSLLELLDYPTSTRSAQDEVTTDDGRTFKAHMSLVDSVGWVVVMQDISDLKELDRVKSDFVTSISHDLRSPLTAILSYVELMSRAGNLNEQQSLFTAQVKESVSAITTLLNELLELDKIEAGLDSQREPVSLLEIVQKALEIVRTRADLKKQQIAVEVPGYIPLIMGNRMRLRQVFVNLLDNAVKYSPEGSRIQISLWEQSGQVVAIVSDTGMGIPADEQPYIFEKFYRSRKVSSSHEGIGLGLSIVRSIVEAHGGRIWVESHPGKGTSFTIVLPSLIEPQPAAR